MNPNYAKIACVSYCGLSGAASVFYSLSGNGRAAFWAAMSAAWCVMWLLLYLERWWKDDR